MGCLVGWIYGRKIGGLGVFSLDPPKYSLQIGKKTWMPTKDQFCPSSLCMCVEQLELCFPFSFFLFSFFFQHFTFNQTVTFFLKIFFNQREGFLVAFTSTFFFKAPLIVIYIYISTVSTIYYFYSTPEKQGDKLL